MTTTARHIRQAAAIPIRCAEICLVTSADGKRWVLPKGTIEPGETAGETALREAWEEAGLSGALQQGPVGSYHYVKRGRSYHVTLFLLQVGAVAEEWPEKGHRLRRWVHGPHAARQVAQPELSGLLERILSEEGLEVPV